MATHFSANQVTNNYQITVLLNFQIITLKAMLLKMLAKIVHHFLSAVDNSLFFSMKMHTEVTDYRTTRCPASIKRLVSFYI